MTCMFGSCSKNSIAVTVYLKFKQMFLFALTYQRLYRGKYLISSSFQKCIKWLKDYRNPCFHLPPVNISSINVTDASTIRCLPFYYLIGFPKCGSTDLYESISRHPTMVRAGKKEPHWWSRRRLWKWVYVFLVVIPQSFHNKSQTGFHVPPLPQCWSTRFEELA